MIANESLKSKVYFYRYKTYHITYIYINPSSRFPPLSESLNSSLAERNSGDVFLYRLENVIYLSNYFNVIKTINYKFMSGSVVSVGKEEDGDISLVDISYIG